MVELYNRTCDKVKQFWKHVNQCKVTNFLPSQKMKMQDCRKLTIIALLITQLWIVVIYNVCMITWLEDEVISWELSPTWRCEQLTCEQHLAHHQHNKMSYVFRQGDFPKLNLQVDRGVDFKARKTQWSAYTSLSGLDKQSASKQVQALTLCFSRFEVDPTVDL